MERRREAGPSGAPGHAYAGQEADWLEAILEVSDDAVVVVDPEGTVLLWGPGAERLYGYSADELVGRRASEVLRATAGAGERAEAARRLAAGEPTAADVDCVRKDGSAITVWVKRSPVMDEDGRLLAVVGISRDVTEERRVEQQLRDSALALVAANKELTAANEFKERFVANISHELRTPLTVILGFGAALSDPVHRSDPEMLNVAVAAINRQAGRLDRLVQDLLTLSKLEGGVSVAVEETSLAPLLQTTVAESSTRPERWRLSVPTDLTVHADPDRLAQIVANIVANAERHGAPPFAIEAGPAGIGGVTIRIADSGSGIDPAFVPYLFERFAQGRGYSGSYGAGLGLAIARGLARAHGGDVRYEPNQPNGSTFVVTLLASHPKNEHTLDTDAVTGLPNRLQVDQVHARLRARRRGRGDDYSVLIVAVDGIGEINEQFGRKAGDAVLREVARALMVSVRSGDVVGRTGGGEFVVLLTSGAVDATRRAASRITDAVASLAITGISSPVSISIGWATSAEDDDPLATAGARMFEAKSANC